MQKQTDKLTEIYSMAQLLIAEINKKTNEPILINNLDSLSRTCTAIIHESCELQDHCNWKWWKQPTPFSYENAREEVIDILHFVIQACVILNLKPDQILTEFQKKHVINMERQYNGY